MTVFSVKNSYSCMSAVRTSSQPANRKKELCDKDCATLWSKRVAKARQFSTIKNQSSFKEMAPLIEAGRYTKMQCPFASPMLATLS